MIDEETAVFIKHTSISGSEFDIVLRWFWLIGIFLKVILILIN